MNKQNTKKSDSQTKRKETKFDMVLDFVQLSFGVVLILFGMYANNNIALGIGGLLLLFCRREISFPFKNKN